MSLVTQADWGALLPLLTAFVAGEKVQCMDYSGRWVDTNTVYALMTVAQYRLKPADSQMGVWTRPFTVREVGSVNGATGSGEMRWEGSDTDTPKWPAGHGVEYTAQPTFTPNLQGRSA